MRHRVLKLVVPIINLNVGKLIKQHLKRSNDVTSFIVEHGSVFTKTQSLYINVDVACSVIVRFRVDFFVTKGKRLDQMLLKLCWGCACIGFRTILASCCIVGYSYGLTAKDAKDRAKWRSCSRKVDPGLQSVVADGISLGWWWWWCCVVGIIFECVKPVYRF